MRRERNHGRAKRADMNTIKKWYNGTNVPSAINLIILARVSPSVKVMLLLLIDTNELE